MTINLLLKIAYIYRWFTFLKHGDLSADMDERPLSSFSNQRWLTWAGKSEFQMGYIWDFVRSKCRVFQHAMFDHQKVPQWTNIKHGLGFTLVSVKPTYKSQLGSSSQTNEKKNTWNSLNPATKEEMSKEIDLYTGMGQQLCRPVLEGWTVMVISSCPNPFVGMFKQPLVESTSYPLVNIQKTM